MSKNKRTSVTASALLIIILTIVSRIFGFFRESTIAALYGATGVTDAYFMAFDIVTILFSLIGAGCITVVFQPYYTKLLVSESHEASDKLGSNVLNVLLCVSILITALITIFAKPLVHFFAPNFSSSQIANTIPTLRLFSVAYVFSICGLVFSAVMNGQKRFLGPQLIGLPPSICVIVGGILLSKSLGIYAIIYSTMLGWVLQAAMMVFFSRKHFRYSFFIDVKDKNIRLLLLLAIPTFIGIAIGDINTTVNRMLASGLSEGSISGMNFASRLMNLINGVLAISIGTAIFPDLSEYVTLKNKKAFSGTLAKSLSFLSFALIPITPFVIVFRNEIVRLVFERGAFDQNATQVTASVFACYSLSLLFLGFRDILNRAFYAMYDTKTPMINSMLSLGLNIVLNLIFVRYWQAPGLALATSISTIICSVLLVFSFRKKVENLFQRNISVNIAKITAATVLAMTAAIVFKKQVHVENQWFSFIATFAVAFLIYIAACWLVKVSEVQFMLQLMRKILARLSHKQVKDVDASTQIL